MTKLTSSITFLKRSLRPLMLQSNNQHWDLESRKGAAPGTGAREQLLLSQPLRRGTWGTQQPRKGAAPGTGAKTTPPVVAAPPARHHGAGWRSLTGGPVQGPTGKGQRPRGRRSRSQSKGSRSSKERGWLLYKSKIVTLPVCVCVQWFILTANN